MTDREINRRALAVGRAILDCPEAMDSAMSLATATHASDDVLDSWAEKQRINIDALDLACIMYAQQEDDAA